MAGIVGITGMGILSSISNNISEFKEAIKLGRSNFSMPETKQEPDWFCGIAAKIQNFSFLEKLNQLSNIPKEYLLKAKRLGQRAPFTVQIAILTALEAWSNAGLFSKKQIPERIGLIVASQNSTRNYQYSLIPKFQKNPDYLSPRYALEFLETNQIGILSELLEIKGEGFVVGGASATGNVGLIKGFQSIKADLYDLCLVVGVVADLSPMEIQGFINSGAMGGKKFRNQPHKACRPFDIQHEGFIYGQAGGSIILESDTSASVRKIRIQAEIKGGAIILDSNSSSNPNPDGEKKAMLSAIQKSGCLTSDIDYINTHGSSSPLGDQAEIDAIRQLFKSQIPKIWLNATKGLTGHCIYSAGIVEVIATVLQMNGSFLHPNKNLEEPICKELNFCGKEVMEKQINTALSNSFGFGGINTSIVVKRSRM